MDLAERRRTAAVEEQRRAADHRRNRWRARRRRVAPLRRNANARNSRRRFASGRFTREGARGEAGRRRSPSDARWRRRKRIRASRAGDARQSGDGRATRRMAETAAATLRRREASTRFAGATGGPSPGDANPGRRRDRPSSPLRSRTPRRRRARPRRPRSRERRESTAGFAVEGSLALAAAGRRSPRSERTREKATHRLHAAQRADAGVPTTRPRHRPRTDRRRGRRGGRRRVRDPSALRGAGAAAIGTRAKRRGEDTTPPR